MTKNPTIPCEIKSFYIWQGHQFEILDGDGKEYLECLKKNQKKANYEVFCNRKLIEILKEFLEKGQKEPKTEEIINELSNQLLKNEMDLDKLMWITNPKLLLNRIKLLGWRKEELEMEAMEAAFEKGRGILG